MIKINLLPVEEIKQKIKARRLLLLFVAAFASLLAGLALFIFIQSTIANDLKKENQRLEVEHQSYKKTIDQIKQLEKDQAEVQRKIGVVETLQYVRPLAVRVMDEVSISTPPDTVWLQSMEIMGAQLRIQAMARDNRTLAEYMEKIEASPFIAGVELTSSTMSMDKGMSLKSFGLECEIAMPPKPEAKTDAKTDPQAPVDPNKGQAPPAK